MENGAFAPKEQSSIFHNIFKYVIFQRRQKVLLWSKGLRQIFKVNTFSSFPTALPFIVREHFLNIGQYTLLKIFNGTLHVSPLTIIQMHS